MTSPISALVRATLFVSDLARSIRFYRALGLTETYFEGVLGPGSGGATILGFQTDGEVSVCIVKRAGPNYGMIGLFEIGRPLVPQVLPRPEGPARVGEVALIFYVASMKRAMDAARDNGATWLPEPQLFSLPHTAQAEVCIRDPDGVLINLVEKDPAAQDETWPVGQPPA